MSRRFGAISTLTVRVPSHIAHAIQLLHIDPYTGRVRYGELSALATKLFSDYLSTLQVKAPPDEPR